MNKTAGNLMLIPTNLKLNTNDQILNELKSKLLQNTIIANTTG